MYKYRSFELKDTVIYYQSAGKCFETKLEDLRLIWVKFNLKNSTWPVQ